VPVSRGDKLSAGAAIHLPLFEPWIMPFSILRKVRGCQDPDGGTGPGACPFHLLHQRGAGPLIELGVFIPAVDHMLPPDVSFENYLYYLERKREVLLV